MNVPTPANLRVYDTLRAFYREHDRSPSQGELAAELGVTRRAVHNHLRRLVRAGLVEHSGSRYHGYRPIDRERSLAGAIVRRVTATCTPNTMDGVLRGAWMMVEAAGLTAQTWVPKGDGDETCRYIERAWARLVGQLVEQEVGRGE